MNLFVGPQKPSSWSLNADVFADALQARWPSARVDLIEDPGDSEVLTFTLVGDDGPVEGALARTGRTLILEYGSARDIAALVVWFRGLSPELEDLVMVNDGGGAYAVITPKTTQAEIALTVTG